MSVPKRRATYDLMQVPDHMVAELIDGELIVVVEVLEDRRAVRAEPFDAVEIDLGRWWIVDPPA